MRIKDQIPSLKAVYTFLPIDGAPNWEEVLESGRKSDRSAELQKAMDSVNEEDLATLIYTSGTTGRPKGVMLSHKNIATNATDCQDRFPVSSGSWALSFLPVCHIFERMLSYLYSWQGIPIYFGQSLETVGDDIREVQPHIFTAVPRLLEKVFDKIMAKGSDLTGVKKSLFFWAVGLAEEFELSGKSFGYNLQLALARKLIFSKWHEALGGNVRAISGSAALNPKLNLSSRRHQYSGGLWPDRDLPGHLRERTSAGGQVDRWRGPTHRKCDGPHCRRRRDHCERTQCDDGLLQTARTHR